MEFTPFLGLQSLWRALTTQELWLVGLGFLALCLFVSNLWDYSKSICFVGDGVTLLELCASSVDVYPVRVGQSGDIVDNTLYRRT